MLSQITFCCIYIVKKNRRILGMWKKTMSLMLALLVGLVYCQAPAMAAENGSNTVAPQATHIAMCNCYISLSSGNVTCQGSARSRYTDTTTHLLMTLQRRAVGSNTWLAVYTWTTTASGTATARINQTRAVSSGYDYRTFVRCTIKDADGVILETQSAYSNIVTY